VVDRLILVGFMCSGKSTVGRLVADRVGWEFVDFDDAIERAEGRRVAEIFRDRGESYFRGLEADLTRRLADRRRVVLAPGGGWIAQPGLLDLLRPASLMVWLRVSPETVYERCGAAAGSERPLLAGPDPLATIRSLLAERAPRYGAADETVDTDGRDPAGVAEEIVGMLRRRGAPIRGRGAREGA
jgi:shikimate kinase